MKNFGSTLFSRKWFCNHKKFSTKQLLMKIFGSNLFPRKWFCNHKKFSTKKFFMKISGSNLFSRKWFCNHKNILTNNFRWKILVQTCSRGNDFATINIFDQKSSDEKFWFKPVFEEMILQSSKILDQIVFYEILVSKLFSRKLFCNHKKFSTKKCLIKILGSNQFSRKWFCYNKKFSKTNLMKIFVLTCFRGNDFATIINFRQKVFWWKFSVEHVFLEMILQP